MLEMLSLCPTAQKTTAEDVVYSLQLLPENLQTQWDKLVFNWQPDIPSHIVRSPSRVSKAANFWHFTQIPPLAPPDRISPNQSLCCYLDHWQTFPTSCHHQIIISIADSWDIKHVPFPVFQNAIDLNVSLSIGGETSAFLNVSTVCLWELHLCVWQRFLFQQHYLYNFYSNPHL